jgi:hypothetical protein
MVTVTFDTNLVDDEQLLSAAHDAGFTVAHTSVTDREISGSGIRAVGGRRAQLFETGIVGESVVGAFVPGGDDQAVNLEQVLKIISSGSFPIRAKRQHLSDGERRQLRDAMILCTHIRERRDIFVTNDQRGFISHGHREALQQQFGIQILTRDEFLTLCHNNDGGANV